MTRNTSSPFPEKRVLSSVGQVGRDLCTEVEHLHGLGFSSEVSTALVLHNKTDSLRSVVDILSPALGCDLAVEMISSNSKDLVGLFESDEARFRLFVMFLSELKGLIPTLIACGDFSITDFSSIEKLASIRNRLSAHMRTSSSQQEDS